MKSKNYLSVLLLLFALYGNAQWSVINTLTQGGLYSINFMNADTGFAYNEFGIMRKTVDGGQSWDTVQIPFKGFVHDMAFADAQTGYAVGGAWFPFMDYYAFSIMKTMDGGATWDSVIGTYSGGVFNSVAVTGSNEFFAAGILGVVHSADGGTTLDTLQISNVPFTYERYERIRFTTSTKGHIIANVWSSAKKHINLYETNDGGQSWQILFNDTAAYGYVDFVIDDSGNGLVIGRKGKVWRTTDGGATWSDIALGDPNLMLTKVEERNGHLHAIGENRVDTTSGIYHSPDFGLTWYKEFTMSGVQGGINDLSIPTTNVGYFVSWTDIYKSTNIISVNENHSAEFRIYPNPASDIINITGESALYKVILYNSTGQKVMEQTASGESACRLSTTALKAGLYIMEVQHAEGSFTTRIVKK